MGSRLVAHACMPMAELGLSPRARLVLIQVARMSKDTDDPPVYYGGWPFLADVLGFDSYTTGAHQAVARAVRELTTAGLIKPHGPPSPGRNVDYELRL